MPKTGYVALRDDYLKQSDKFTETNKQYLRAVRNGTLTDELELKFMKAERDLHTSYKTMQVAKIEGIAAGLIDAVTGLVKGT